MEKLGFLVMNHEVKLYGLCSECRKNEEKKKSCHGYLYTQVWSSCP